MMLWLQLVSSLTCSLRESLPHPIRRASNRLASGHPRHPTTLSSPRLHFPLALHPSPGMRGKPHAARNLVSGTQAQHRQKGKNSKRKKKVVDTHIFIRNPKAKIGIWGSPPTNSHCLTGDLTVHIPISDHHIGFVSWLLTLLLGSFPPDSLVIKYSRHKISLLFHHLSMNVPSFNTVDSSKAHQRLNPSTTPPEHHQVVFFPLHPTASTFPGTESLVPRSNAPRGQDLAIRTVAQAPLNVTVFYQLRPSPARHPSPHLAASSSAHLVTSSQTPRLPLVVLYLPVFASPLAFVALPCQLFPTPPCTPQYHLLPPCATLLAPCNPSIPPPSSSTLCPFLSDPR
ncbi:hypothetical protein B0J13DRAFT_324493 [Dactylonectria estremocensis]|uniref:Uncharacterized protein n=1 Tax=Dactylonectria estremocensis TaxID=1079267 RepID=A0A9P9EU52_9HYPO|nr:hypothetical protein B0J13DRAFT_324493 [Dactylonectria estremocensis]